MNQEVIIKRGLYKTETYKNFEDLAKELIAERRDISILEVEE